MSPVDVQLDCDDKTMVQPDVSILCDDSKYQGGRIFGAPDFILEVISPSTKKKDFMKKSYKYMNAGVREPVHIGIYEGKLMISFEYVLELIQRYRDK